MKKQRYELVRNPDDSRQFCVYDEDKGQLVIQTEFESLAIGVAMAFNGLDLETGGALGTDALAANLVYRLGVASGLILRRQRD